jgi:hypothetical protein
MGSYRISQSAGLYSNLPLDAEIPQSGPISFSQLRGKRLNVVVDISGGDEYRVNMRSKYDANAGVTVIGGFKSKPANPSEKRILVSVNKKIGSSKESRNHVALRTGNWGTSTSLEVLLGSSARIIGSGGDGGNFTTSQSTQSGTAVYASPSIHYTYNSKSGNFLGPFWGKNTEEPSPPAGDWTSGWYVGNQFIYESGKYSVIWYEARRDWSAVNNAFTAGSGSSGSSALGVEYPCTINNYGYIQTGFGGGGAGGYRSF